MSTPIYYLNKGGANIAWRAEDGTLLAIEEKTPGAYYFGGPPGLHYNFTITNRHTEDCDITINLDGKFFRKVRVKAGHSEKVDSFKDDNKMLVLQAETSGRAMDEGAIIGDSKSGLWEFTCVWRKAEPTWGFRDTRGGGVHTKGFGGGGRPAIDTRGGGGTKGRGGGGDASQAMTWGAPTPPVPTFSFGASPSPSSNPPGGAAHKETKESKSKGSIQSAFTVHSDKESSMKWNSVSPINPEDIDVARNVTIMFRAYIDPSKKIESAPIVPPRVDELP